MYPSSRYYLHYFYMNHLYVYADNEFNQSIKKYAGCQWGVLFTSGNSNRSRTQLSRFETKA